MHTQAAAVHSPQAPRLLEADGCREARGAGPHHQQVKVHRLSPVGRRHLIVDCCGVAPGSQAAACSHSQGAGSEAWSAPVAAAVDWRQRRRQAHLSARDSTGSARISVGASRPIHGDSEAAPLLSILPDPH